MQIWYKTTASTVLYIVQCTYIECIRGEEAGGMGYYLKPCIYGKSKSWMPTTAHQDHFVLTNNLWGDKGFVWLELIDGFREHKMSSVVNFKY